jgi:hypothetical protein
MHPKEIFVSIEVVHTIFATLQKAYIMLYLIIIKTFFFSFCPL